jgi:hypothetical protein
MAQYLRRQAWVRSREGRVIAKGVRRNWGRVSLAP